MGKNARRWALMSGALLVATIGLLSIAPGADAADDADKVAWLGVYTQSLDDDLRDGLEYRGNGVLVNRVVDDGPAAKAGVQNGDVIVRFNNRQIDSPSELAELVREGSVGQRVSIQVMREGQRRTMNITLGEREESGRDGNAWYWNDDGDQQRVRIPRVHVERHGDTDADHDIRIQLEGLGRPMLGVQVHYMNEDLATYFGTKNGALVLEVSKESAAEKAGIKAGDVITRVGERDIEGSNDIISELRKSEEGEEVSVTLMRKGKSMQVTAKLEDSHVGYFWGDGGDAMVLRDLEGLGDLRELRHLGDQLRVHGKELRVDEDEARRVMRELRNEMRELQRRLKELEDSE